MVFLKFAAIISGVFGLLFLFAPKTLERVNDAVNKILLNLDEALLKMRVGIGILLCIASVVMFFIIYYAGRFGIR